MPQDTPITLWSRALHLRCPRCGQGKLFLGWFRMPERCSACRLKFERSPGYFLGSTYFNYGLTALITTAIFIALRFSYQIPKEWIAPPLAAFCLVWPLFWFRYARALWLAFDAYFDPAGFENDDGPGDGIDEPTD